MSRREALLARLAGPDGPTDPTLRARWEALDQRDRARLRACATDPGAARHLDGAHERTLVDALAAQRAVRSPVALLAPVLTGLLVLSTLWGFGRAAFPDVAGWFLLAGLLGLVTTALVGWRAGARRRAAAREVRAVLRT